MAQPATREIYSDNSISAAVFDLQTTLVSTVCDGDVDFYRMEASGASHVLELGVGTGRVAWSLAEAGHHVTGIDVSKAMLAIAADKRADHIPVVSNRLQLHQADMAEFLLPERYDLAIAPFRSFNQLAEPDQAAKCLRHIHKHLQPGGRAILHLMPFPEHLLNTLGEPPPDEPLELVFPNGAILTAQFCHRTVDFSNQLLRLGIDYTYRDANGVVQDQSREFGTLRWFGWPEFRYLAALSDFVVQAEYSDFYGSPLRAGGEQVWILAKPS